VTVRADRAAVEGSRVVDLLRCSRSPNNSALAKQGFGHGTGACVHDPADHLAIREYAEIVVAPPPRGRDAGRS
jgi:hypothetical protein